MKLRNITYVVLLVNSSLVVNGENLSLAVDDCYTVKKSDGNKFKND